MKKINQKELNEMIKKGVKSKYQNCFKCNWFPKSISKNIIKPFKSIGYEWGIPNIEQIEFGCKYLNKRVSQSIKPFQSNHCLCFKNSN